MIRHAIRALLVVAFVAAGVSLSGPQASAASAGAAPGIAPLIGVSAARTTTMTTVTTRLRHRRGPHENAGERIQRCGQARALGGLRRPR